MNNPVKLTRFAVTLLLLTFSMTGYASADVTLLEHQMKVQGKSSMHDWESEVREMKLVQATASTTGAAIKELVLDVPVKAIVSEHGRMDKLTYKALDSEKSPSIRYELSVLEQVEGEKWKASGKLTIAGDTQPFEMEVTITEVADGKITVSGAPIIDMREFGVKPPSLMMGAIKVGPEVRTPFKVTLSVTN